MARRTLSLAAATVVIGAVSVVVPHLGLGHESANGVAASAWGLLPASADAAGCHNKTLPVPGPFDPDTYVGPDSWAEIPAISRVLYTIEGRSLVGGGVNESPGVCDARPIAVFYGADLARAISVYRDVNDVFYGAPESLLAPVVVQGNPGRVLTPPAGVHYLTWVDSDGIRWFVEASGMSVDDLIAALDGTVGAAGAPAAPAGYVAADIPESDPSETVFRWTATFADGTYLEVTTPVRAPVEAVLSTGKTGAELTSVGSWRALYVPQDQGGASLRWSTPEATFRLVVPGASEADLVRDAVRLVLTSPSDARLVSAGN